MSNIEATIYKESDGSSHSVWAYLISVIFSAVLIIFIGKFVLDVYPQSPDFLMAEKVASETFSQYAQRLDELRNEYSQVLPADRE